MKIKVGDIFYKNYYNGGLATFYQVVPVYESGRVKVREIEHEEKKTECGYEFLATPLPNQFCPKREYGGFGKYDADIKDNDKGAIKLIQYLDNNEPVISFQSEYAHLYKGKSIISNYYSIWMK